MKEGTGYIIILKRDITSTEIETVIRTILQLENVEGIQPYILYKEATRWEQVQQ